MKQDPFAFLFLAGLILGISSLVSAGPIAGIARTDGQPLETGPFDSQPSAAGPQITHEFQPMYLTLQPTTWTKTFRWEIPANTGLAPGATLNIVESIPLLYPADLDHLVKLPIADWHETMEGGDLGGFVQWDTQNPNTRILAHIGSETIPINGHVSFSSDSKTIWFDFVPIQIHSQGELGSAPVTLDIFKSMRWTGPVLDPIPTLHHIDILVTEYPTTTEPVGDYNQNGTVDTADYTVWRNNLGSATALPNDDTPGVGPDDYTRWKTHFGEFSGNGSGASANAAVPEPASLVLLILAVTVVTARRGRGPRRVSILFGP